MKASELRIGNWVNIKMYPYENEAHRVHTIHGDNTFTIDLKGKIEGCFRTSIIEPIPLTEEWLLKFGFQKYNNDPAYGQEFFDKGISIFYKEDEFRFYTSRTNRAWSSYEYVHELQNLYFALTGKELTIE